MTVSRGSRPEGRTQIANLFRGMNKTEKSRAIELEAMRRNGEIAAWWYEAVTFKLADDCRYTPDFLVQENDGALRVEEVKGFWREDARVKLKVFASLFPFPLTVYVRAKGGGWEREEFNAVAA